jgi:hypothetical protein
LELILLQDFILFILVPFAAALLIREDLDLELEDAADIRDSSNGYGDMLQPDNSDDDLIESLRQDNIEAMKDFRDQFMSLAPRVRRTFVPIAECLHPKFLLPGFESRATHVRL